MADNKEVSSTKKSAAAAANKKRTWNDDEVETLIDMYEARPCLYESSWIFMDKMRFIEHVKKTAKSTSTIKITSALETIEDEEDESEKEEETPVKQSAKETPVNNNKRKRTHNSAEQKQKLISKCIDVLDRPKNPTKEKEHEELCCLQKNESMTYYLLEMRFEEFDEPTRFNPGVQNQRFAAPPMQGPYTAMLNNDF